MFGYILPEKQELKIREYEHFRAYYCGVCKAISKRCGQIPRLMLNYDITFLAILVSSVVGEKISVKMERCIAHPIKKRKVIRNSNVIDYASDMNIILAYYNLMDNWEDEKSLISGSGMLALKSCFLKLRKKYNKKCDIIEKRLRKLSNLEKELCNSMDKVAEPFAELMGEIVAHEPLCSSENEKTVLRWIGYNLGKWIYILDAYDDLEKDIKKSEYNPLVYQFDFKNENADGIKGESIESFKSRIKDRVEFNLTYALNQIANAYELLETKGNKGIIENIIYMGMLRKTEQILTTGSCSNIEKSI